MKLSTLKKTAALIADFALGYFLVWVFIAFILWDAGWMTMPSARLVGAMSLYWTCHSFFKKSASE